MNEETLNPTMSEVVQVLREQKDELAFQLTLAQIGVQKRDQFIEELRKQVNTQANEGADRTDAGDDSRDGEAPSDS